MTMFGSQWFANPGVVYEIDQSCRFNDDDNANLVGPTISSGSERIGTWSFWYKRANLGQVAEIYDVYRTSTSNMAIRIRFDGSDNLQVTCENDSGAAIISRVTTQVFRDSSAWGNLHIKVDTGQTDDTSCVIYHNGVQITDFGTKTNPGSATDANLFTSGKSAYIGATPAGAGDYDGYLSQFTVQDGVVGVPADVGETSSTTGQWIPKSVSGLTFGTNGFYIDFQDSTFLGQDVRTTGDQVNSYASSQWGGSTGSYSFSDGRIETSTDNKAIKSDDTFAGDFEFQWMYKDKANWVIGVYETGEDGTFNDSNSNGGMASMTDSWYIQASSVSANNDIKYGSTTVVDSTTIANGDTWKISRSSGTLKIERNGSTIHTWAATSTNTVRIVFAQGDDTADAEAVNWVDNNTLGNNFFSTGLAAADQVVDTPTDNYCTLNPLTGNSGITYSDGNLNPGRNGSSFQTYFGTQALPSTGKWYWEITAIGGTAPIGTGAGWDGTVGIGTKDADDSPQGESTNWVWGNAKLTTGGQKHNGSSINLYPASSLTDNSIVMTAVDMTNSKIWWGVDGSWMGTDNGDNDGDPAAGSNPAFDNLSGELFPLGNRQDDYEIYNFGQQSFAHTPPTGFSALSTANLPDPTIADPSGYFQPTIYTGNGSTQSIDQGENSTFSPNLVWIKNRDAADNHCWFDTVRGATELLSSNNTDAESTDADTLTAFDSDGFSLGDDDKVNTNTEKYVGWQWLESATPGFDMVSYTGTGSARTVSHSLGVKPDLMIFKRRDGTQNWGVYHHIITADYVLNFDLTNASLDDAAVFNDTEPTSSVFTVNTDGKVNASTQTYIAWLWAGVEGFSKFGSYTGNGSADGPFVWCGFRPSTILLKRTDAVNDWTIKDSTRNPYNPVSHALIPDATNTEYTATWVYVDILSNGFKVRSTDNSQNTSGGTYVFGAWADTPFKTANAR